MITDEQKEKFREFVIRCLVNGHGLDEDELRKELEDDE